MDFELKPLPYADDALEPYIGRATLTLHHGKHHQGYLAKLKEDGKAVSLDVPATSGSWTGTFDGESLTGTWTQPGGSLPLTFTRAPSGR